MPLKPKKGASYRSSASGQSRGNTIKPASLGNFGVNTPNSPGQLNGPGDVPYTYSGDPQNYINNATQPDENGITQPYLDRSGTPTGLPYADTRHKFLGLIPMGQNDAGMLNAQSAISGVNNSQNNAAQIALARAMMPLNNQAEIARQAILTDATQQREAERQQLEEAGQNRRDALLGQAENDAQPFSGVVPVDLAGYHRMNAAKLGSFMSQGMQAGVPASEHAAQVNRNALLGAQTENQYVAPLTNLTKQNEGLKLQGENFGLSSPNYNPSVRDAMLAENIKKTQTTVPTGSTIFQNSSINPGVFQGALNTTTKTPNKDEFGNITTATTETQSPAKFNAGVPIKAPNPNDPNGQAPGNTGVTPSTLGGQDPNLQGNNIPDPYGDMLMLKASMGDDDAFQQLLNYRAWMRKGQSGTLK